MLNISSSNALCSPVILFINFLTRHRKKYQKSNPAFTWFLSGFDENQLQVITMLGFNLVFSWIFFWRIKITVFYLSWILEKPATSWVLGKPRNCPSFDPWFLYVYENPNLEMISPVLALYLIQSWVRSNTRERCKNLFCLLSRFGYNYGLLNILLYKKQVWILCLPLPAFC